MVQITLLDHLGFTVGTPEIPRPFPRVVAWGEDFFLLNDEDDYQGCENPRYHRVSGAVITDTKDYRTSKPQ